MKVIITKQVKVEEEVEVELPLYFQQHDSVEASWWENSIKIDNGGMMTLTKRGDGRRIYEWEVEKRIGKPGDYLGYYLTSIDYSRSTEEAFNQAKAEFLAFLNNE